MVEAYDDAKLLRLRAIATLLGVGTEAFGLPSSSERLVKLLRLWNDLPSEAAQDDVLGFMHLLCRKPLD